jgi:D-beta-D-heptose 7-phosphate kinase/D-beta-D-heptose 1-phosphate adenosyltransferase
MEKLSAKRKILTPRRLAAVLARRKARGEAIVFTNGVYDLIHAGHVTLLEKSRRLGDCLVVGINSDSSVRRLKGPKRPLAVQADRLRVLAAIESVDYVTIFKEDTPQQLIELLKPTVLVKGGDYAVSQIVGRDVVKKVVRIPLVKGRSTSALVEKILKAYGR